MCLLRTVSYTQLFAYLLDMLQERVVLEEKLQDFSVSEGLNITL